MIIDINTDLEGDVITYFIIYTVWNEISARGIYNVIYS
jgi:hypothetical protein